MRLTRAGEYAVRCVLYLSTAEKGTVVNRKEIAAQMDIPEQFLGKIAQQLARSGILEIVQGARGGYRLIVSPDRLTLLDVVESAVGEIFLNDCISRFESCNRSSSCSIHRIWDKARNRLRETLREVTFGELHEPQTCFPSPQSRRNRKSAVTRRRIEIS
jgi:Rrf2 family protein